MPYARPKLTKLRDVNPADLADGFFLRWDAERGKHVYAGIDLASLGAAAAVHSHAISDVTGLQAALDGKAPSSHTHAQGDITGLQAALEARALLAGWDASRVIVTDGDGDLQTGTITVTQLDSLSGISGNVQTQLDGKSAVGHGHSQDDVTGLVDALSAKADLIGGVVPSSQLPALVKTDVYTVDSEEDMLELEAQAGDLAIRTDLGKTFAHNGGTDGTAEDWSELISPTDAVWSVNGLIGSVVLGYADVGAAAESHTHAIADVTSLQDELDAKAGASDLTAHTGNTSNPHSVTKSQVGLGNVSNDAQLKIASNLSDLNNAATARSNLGIPAFATSSTASAVPQANGSGKIDPGWIDMLSGLTLGTSAAGKAVTADASGLVGLGTSPEASFRLTASSIKSTGGLQAASAYIAGGLSVGDTNTPISGGLLFARAGSAEPFIRFANDSGSSGIAQIRGISGGGLKVTAYDGTTLWAVFGTSGNLTLAGSFEGRGTTRLGAANTALADGSLSNSQINMWLDESNNKLKFKCKYSNGTVKSGEIALT